MDCSQWPEVHTDNEYNCGELTFPPQRVNEGRLYWSTAGPHSLHTGSGTVALPCEALSAKVAELRVMLALHSWMMSEGFQCLL